MNNTNYKIAVSKCFTVYQEEAIDWKGYILFDIHQDGKHLDYIVKNKKTGKYFWTPNSLLIDTDVEVISQYIDNKLIYVNIPNK